MPEPKGASDPERMERAEGFLAAAREHHVFLSSLPPEPPHYPLAYYVAGLAVECLFRAYTELVGAKHDPNHDLRRHAEDGRFLEFMPPSLREDVRADLGDVYTRWLNNHRYRSLSSLRVFLNERQLYRVAGTRTVKGNVVRYNWEVLLNASLRLLTLGVRRWEISKKKWNRS